tara:strand:- start:26 stop:265 length:240 start_codon:yes stop_codon:yes gene_type:complete
MSAEKEALQYLNEIFTIIKETLEEAKENRTNARQLSNEENKALTDITNKLKQVRTNLDKYLKQFRVQTSLTDFGVDIDE